jgi:hypothetical protein
VRGIRLNGDDRVVSMSIIRHFDATADERAAYLKMRRAMAGVADDEPPQRTKMAEMQMRKSARTLCGNVRGRKPDPDDHSGRIRKIVIQP